LLAAANQLFLEIGPEVLWTVHAALFTAADYASQYKCTQSASEIGRNPACFGYVKLKN
jgi:hypothetical protein